VAVPTRTGGYSNTQQLLVFLVMMAALSNMPLMFLLLLHACCVPQPVGAGGGTRGMATANSRAPPGTGAVASELQERFNRLKEKEGGQDQ
jgi:hypothetical protein